MNAKHLVHIIVFGTVTSDSDIMAPFMASDSTWRPTLSARREVVLYLDREGGYVWQ